MRRIAPFLRLDDDPYMVVADGRLFWILDAYTTADSLPYSEPVTRSFNYIRNSVKVVVDAYHGSVDFYSIDPEDPILKAYGAAMPGLFKPLSTMPESIKRHLRYPRDIFAAQVRAYKRYHMAIPQVFYNNEDLWTLAREKYGGKLAPMIPYYILMRLPEEERLQFLLMIPLTPENRENMIGWIAARSDFPGYGQLIVYKFPKDRLLYGPLQVEALIDQDTLISRQISLWDQRGSKVIRGNLLVIPIRHSILYVEPVYLIAEITMCPSSNGSSPPMTVRSPWHRHWKAPWSSCSANRRRPAMLPRRRPPACPPPCAPPSARRRAPLTQAIGRPSAGRWANSKS